MPNAPTEERFLQLVERLFGSRSPDLEAFRKEAERHLMESYEQANTDTTRGHLTRKILKMKARQLSTIIDATRFGLDSWQELDRDERSPIVNLLAASEQQFDREAYLMDHTN